LTYLSRIHVLFFTNGGDQRRIKGHNGGQGVQSGQAKDLDDTQR